MMRFSVGILLLMVVAGGGADAALRLEPILETKQGERVAFLPGSDWELMAVKPAVVSTAFFAVVTVSWPAELVPVFAGTGDDGALRRLPPRGLENSTDPLFFASPATDETNGAAVAGTWYCTATNANGSIHHLTWELASDGKTLGGRFDPSTEYRVAFVTGGRFESNQFRLNVDYSNDRYLLVGRLRGGILSGGFQQEDGPEKGVWTATRAPEKVRLLVEGEAVPLFEWVHGKSGQKRYLVEGRSPGAEWRRADRPLCRVWTRRK